LGDLAAAATI